MDIPDLVQEAVGGEDVEAGVTLGDEDLLVRTPTRTLLYRAEGLLSDESVEEYPHDLEGFDVSDGRRKTKFVLEYVDGTKSFAVPGDRGDQVLESLFEGVLGAAGVIEDGESVAGVFRFSELTLVVTEGRVVKHVGAAEWDDDFEEHPFADLTGLAFEEGNVATEVVLEVGGRPQRIKTPNERAREVREVLREAVFAFHGVSTLEELEAAVGTDGADETDADEGDIALDAGIDPLVGDDAAARGTDGTVDGADAKRGFGDPSGSEAGIEIDPVESEGTEAAEPAREAPDPSSDVSEEVEELREEVAELRSAVEQQNDLLREQHRALKRLVDELGGR